MLILKRIARALSIVSMLGIAAYTALVMYWFASPMEDRKFEQLLWKEYHNNWAMNNPRGEMYDDLTENILKPGMDRSAVLDLLGEADMQQNLNLLRYNLGMWSGMRMDYDSLNIEFDESGKLTRTYWLQH